MISPISGITIVICTYNGRGRLLATLDSILKQKVERVSWELLIIDNNSNDGTKEHCEEILRETSNLVSWRVISETTPGLSHARKRGVLESSYQYVIFCDDDNWLNADYVEQAYSLIEQYPKVGVLGGLGIPELDGPEPVWFAKYSKSYAVGPQAPASGYLPANAIIYGAGMVIRKEIMVNLFNKGFTSLLSDRKGSDLVSGGDNEICLWYQQLGYKLYYNECLIFRHQIPANRLTKEYLLSRATGKGKTEAVFRIYSEIMERKTEVKWLNSKLFWYKELMKRFLLWSFLCATPFTFDRKLKRNVLASSIIFRLGNYSYLKHSAAHLKTLMGLLKI